MMPLILSQTTLTVADFPVLLWVLLGLILLFQVLGAVSRILLGRRLKRIESRLAQGKKKERADAKPQEAGADGVKHFEKFLADDPSRRDLPKKEQFAAFRKWRQENGLTWDK